MLNKVLRKGENLPSSAQDLQMKGEEKSPKATTTEIKLQAADPQAAGGRYWRRLFHYCCSEMKGRDILPCWGEKKA